MRKILKIWGSIALVCAGIFIAAAGLAAAQQPEPRKSPFGAGPAMTAGSPAAQSPTGTSGVWGWMVATQAKAQRDMAMAVRDLKTAHPLAAAGSLAFISFVYGVLHAAGPGHGKAVISSYVLANRQTVRRGIFLSFLAAFFQACSAIVLVGVLALALKATSLTMRAAESWIEIGSWALVAIVGVWLLYRQLAPLVRARALAAAGAPLAHPHDHGHGHGYNHSTLAPVQTAHVHGPGCNHADHDHGHDHAHHDHAHEHGHSHGATTVAHAHVHDASCGHAHMPEPAQFEGPWDWGRAISLAATVGVRPCTGAILVMLFALSQGVLWAGVFATFMMSIGTALTVSALAALAVGSRDLAVRFAGVDSPWAHRLESAVGIVGAICVILLGTAGFVVALSGPAPF